jgi:hypothetical protein
VAPHEIDRDLAALVEPKRSTLDALRKSIMEIVPEANQFISYGTPAFKTYLPSPVEPIAQNCPSAVNLCAPNARTERHQTSAARRARTAHPCVHAVLSTAAERWYRRGQPPNRSSVILRSCSCSVVANRSHVACRLTPRD